LLRSVSYRLGHWTFVPSAHELRSGPARVRLEQRASATLSLLCERTDEVVSREQIVDRAWGRRHLSPNSVAVVIGDLRRALDIPPGEPGSIETVPKAGYRLIGGSSVEQSRPRRATVPLLLVALAVLIVLGIAMGLRDRSMRTEIAVGSIENAMGTSGHDALVKACNETVLVQLGRYPHDLRIVETPLAPGERPDINLQQRWVLWSGAPELVLVATDRNGQTVWSGAIFGDENQFPAKISDKIRDLAAFARADRRS
jgi:DNA-binding winged helix-turn-helix (wHTH) protein